MGVLPSPSAATQAVTDFLFSVSSMNNGYSEDSLMSTSTAQTLSPPVGSQTTAQLSFSTRPAFQLKGLM